MTISAPQRTGRSRRMSDTQESAPSALILGVKILLMALVDAFGIFLLMSFLANGQTIVAIAVALGLVAVNIVYFRRGGLAA